MGIFQKSKYIFQENYRLVMYDVDIKDALYFSDTCGILDKMMFYRQQIAYTVMFLTFRTHRSEQTV